MESEDGYSHALLPWQPQELRAGSPSPATEALLAVALKTQPSSFLKPLVRPDRVPSSSVASLGPTVQAAYLVGQNPLHVAVCLGRRQKNV